MSFFFFNDTATTEIYTLSLHDALPICPTGGCSQTGITRTIRPMPSTPQTSRPGPRLCSRPRSISNSDEETRMTKSPLIALTAALTLAAPAAAQVKLNGAGATFPNIIYQDWMLTYNKTHPDVQLNYQSIGSGGGIRQFSDGTVDFGADRKSTRLNS